MRRRLVVVIGTISFALTACGGDDTPDATTPDPAVPTIDSAVPTSEQPAEIGNPAAVSDAGVGALAAEAGMRSGALNVLINLGLIEDKEFVARERAHLEALTAGMPELKEKIVAYVTSKL